MATKKDMSMILEKVEQMTGIIGDHTTMLRVMNNTLHFQASFVRDQGDSYERFAKEVSKHIVRVIAWTYLFCSGGLVREFWEKVRRGRNDVGGGL